MPAWKEVSVKNNADAIIFHTDICSAGTTNCVKEQHN